MVSGDEGGKGRREGGEEDRCSDMMITGGVVKRMKVCEASGGGSLASTTPVGVGDEVVKRSVEPLRSWGSWKGQEED